MKNIILSLTLLFVGFTIHAFGQNNSAEGQLQNTPVKWGAEMKNGVVNEVIGCDETGYYVFRQLNWDNLLEHYTIGLDRDVSVKLVLKQGKKEREYKQLIYYNHQLFLFSIFHNSEQKKEILYMQNVDKKTLLPDNDAKNVCEVTYTDVGWHGGFATCEGWYFHFDISTDSSKLLVQCGRSPCMLHDAPVEKENQQVGCAVFNKDMNELWHKEITMPYTCQLLEIKQFKVDNNGNVNLLARLYNLTHDDLQKGKFVKKVYVSDPRKRMRDYSYHLFSYTENGEKMQEHTLALPDRFITDLTFDIADNAMICAGFYSPFEGNFIRTGCFSMGVDLKNDKVIYWNEKEFDRDFIMKGGTEHDQKQMDQLEAEGRFADPYDYQLDKFILKSDGGAVLMAEQTMNSALTGGIGGGAEWKTYLDIIIINIDTKGKIAWTQKISKRQSAISQSTNNYSSFAFALANDNINFIYNDNVNNLTPAAIPNIYKGVYWLEPGAKDATIFRATINSKGEVSKEVLASNDGSIEITLPKDCMQIANDKMIIFGVKKKTFHFGIMTLD